MARPSLAARPHRRNARASGGRISHPSDREQIQNIAREQGIAPWQGSENESLKTLAQVRVTGRFLRMKTDGLAELFHQKAPHRKPRSDGSAPALHELACDSPGRKEASMRHATASRPPKARIRSSHGAIPLEKCSNTGSAKDFLPQRISLPQLRDASKTCRGCDCTATPRKPSSAKVQRTRPIMFVGEQPGDQEDRAGKPFVGPAGAMLERRARSRPAFRDEVYVTNAVKHSSSSRAARNAFTASRTPERSKPAGRGSRPRFKS